MRCLLALMVLVLGTSPLLAGERTIRLSIPGMYCAACPYIVGEALSAVHGVSAVDARIEDKSATVTFDDDVTTPQAILAATASIGYPSTTAGPGS